MNSYLTTTGDFKRKMDASNRSKRKGLIWFHKLEDGVMGDNSLTIEHRPNLEPLWAPRWVHMIAPGSPRLEAVSW